MPTHPNAIQVPYTLEEIMQILTQHAYDSTEVVFPPGVKLDVNVKVYGEPVGGMPDKELDAKGASQRASYNRVKHLLRPSQSRASSDNLDDKILISGGAMVTFTVIQPAEA